MTEPAPPRKAEIVHCLFMDIVSFSLGSIQQQQRMASELREVVRAAPAYRRAEASKQVIARDTGDGMALIFSGDPRDPAQCAVEIARALRERPTFGLRMGIHTGPVSRDTDITESENVYGGGINMAQRVMDCGDAGHILISQRSADDLSEFEEWTPYLRELGEVQVKHGVRLHLFSLCDDVIGNPERPRKFAATTPEPIPSSSEPTETMFAPTANAAETKPSPTAQPPQLPTETERTEQESRKRPSRFEKGDRIGVFIVEERFAAGGMGVVYKVRNMAADRFEAMKTPTPRSDIPDYVERFLREARATAQLQHPNIASVYSVSEPDSHPPYFTMEFVEGSGLDAHLRNGGPMPPEEAIPILRQMAEALDYAHSKKIAHSDVKPGNALLQPDGRGGYKVKLVDFGIARALTASGNLAKAPTSRFGTLEYVSYEQAMGFPNADYRMDIYSLGAVAHEMLCGKTPIPAGQGSSLETIKRLQPRLPKVMAEALVKALEKEPERRFESCDAFARKLSEGLRPPSPPLWKVAAIFAPLILFAAIGGAILLRGKSAPIERTAPKSVPAPPAQVTQTKTTLTTASNAKTPQRIAEAEAKAAQDLVDRVNQDTKRAAKETGKSEAKINKAVQEANNRSFDKAIRMCNDAIELDSHNKDARQCRAIAYLSKK